MTRITYQMVPAFIYLLSFNKEKRQRMTIEDWLFVPLFILILFIPIIGMLVGHTFYDEDDKWVTRTTIASVYLVIIGTIIVIVSNI